MLWYRVFLVAVSWVGCVLCGYYRNNVCPTLRDYQTIYHNPNCSFNPDVGSTPRLIAKRYGYPFEKHAVTTKDGYILNMHRISGPRHSPGSPNSSRRQPVLIFHGIAGSSAFWMLQGKKSLAFFLADNGYDVWLGNFRGNYFSNKHTNYTITNRDYWNFGFHEMAIYDLPACIEFIADRTGGKGDLVYVGHSMGTTVSFIYSSLKSKHAKEYLKGIVALAPVAFMENVMGTFKLLAPHAPFLSDAKILEAKLNLGKPNRIARIHKFPYAHNDFFLARHLDPFHKSLSQAIRT